MAVCDICNDNVSEGSGFLLTTRMVVSNPAYWEYVFSHQWKYTEDLPNPAAVKADLCRQMAEQDAPWLLCVTCSRLLGFENETTREHATKWWQSGQAFRPPGSGAVPVTEVQLSTSNDERIPRATKCFVFGRQFRPTEEHIELAYNILFEVKKEILVRKNFSSHFEGVFVELISLDVDDRFQFSKDAMALVREKYSDALLLDGIGLDQRGKSALDLMIVAVWDGAEGEKARKQWECVDSSSTSSRPMFDVLPDSDVDFGGFFGSFAKIKQSQLEVIEDAFELELSNLDHFQYIEREHRVSNTQSLTVVGDRTGILTSKITNCLHYELKFVKSKSGQIYGCVTHFGPGLLSAGRVHEIIKHAEESLKTGECKDLPLYPSSDRTWWKYNPLFRSQNVFPRSISHLTLADDFAVRTVTNSNQKTSKLLAEDGALRRPSASRLEKIGNVIKWVLFSFLMLFLLFMLSTTLYSPFD